MTPARTGLTIWFELHLYGVSQLPTNRVPHGPLRPRLVLRLAIVLATGSPPTGTPLSICQTIARSLTRSTPPRNPRADVAGSSTNRGGALTPLKFATWLAPMVPAAVAPVVRPSSKSGTSVPKISKFADGCSAAGGAGDAPGAGCAATGSDSQLNPAVASTTLSGTGNFIRSPRMKGKEPK